MVARSAGRRVTGFSRSTTLPGGTISRARRINAIGEVVGEANVSDGGPFHAVKWVVAPVSTSVDDQLPSSATDREDGDLVRIAPAPFSSGTTIRVSLERPGFATVSIFDGAGRQVRNLVAGWMPSAEQVFTWNGQNDAGVQVPGGVYYVGVSAGGRRSGATVVRLTR